MSTASIRRLTSVLVLATALTVPVVAFAQTPASQATDQQVADWNKEIAQAQAERSAARRVIFGEDRRAHDALVKLKWLVDHGPTPLASSAWQRERDQVMRRRTTGRRAEVVGLAIAATGIGLLARDLHCVERPGCDSPPPSLSLITTAAGFVTTRV